MGPSVLVVDDQAAFRAVARALLERDGFDVVGEAADGITALIAERDLRPDIVMSSRRTRVTRCTVNLPRVSGRRGASRKVGCGSKKRRC